MSDEAMIPDAASPLVIDIAQEFMTLVEEIEPQWSKAYFRFSMQESMSEAKGSYVSESGVQIINVLEHQDFFHPVQSKGQALFNAVGQKKGVFLLIIDSSSNYEIKFEYRNLKRWTISKLSGGTGVPEGLE